MPGMPLSLEYQIRTLAPLRLPVGQAGLPLVAPSLAGATLKGAVRHSAMVVLATLQRAACLADGDPSCPICRQFGAPGRDGALRWGPASLVGGLPARDALDMRRRRPVDRVSGLSMAGPSPLRLALPAGLLFQARLHGWLADDGDSDTALLVAALRRLEYLGGGPAAGYGRVAVSVAAIRLDGALCDGDTLVDSLSPAEAV